jgi:DNA-binding response OmpR family regulator
MTVICPNCGFKHATEPYGEELLDIRMPNLERRALVRLIKARGAMVTREQMVDALYGDHSDGGPDLAEFTLQSHVSKLKKKLAGSAWAIQSRRFEGYRLVRVAP